MAENLNEKMPLRSGVYTKDGAGDRIDRLLTTVSTWNQHLLSDWYQCLAEDKRDQREQAKQEIRTSCVAANRPAIGKNFIARLLNGNGGGYKLSIDSEEYRPRVDLAALFVRAMEENDPDWKDCLEALKDDSIDKLLDKVSQTNDQILQDWYKSFDAGDNDQQVRAKQMIKDSAKLVNERENRRTKCGPAQEENFIVNLSSSQGRVELARSFLYAMKENLYWPVIWKHFVRCTEDAVENTDIALPEIWTALHKRPRKASDSRQVDLHAASFLGDLQSLHDQIGKDPVIFDKHSLTPLHHAAMAITPNDQVVSFLMQWMTGDREYLRNTQSDRQNGWNTALHVAAANVSVTQEFINVFREVDATLLNLDRETPFHVAARSKNPKAIVYMLKTFAPTLDLCDVDYVDELGDLKYVDKDEENRKLSSEASCQADGNDEVGRNYRGLIGQGYSQLRFSNSHKRRNYDKLINICARQVNADAVSLLIKHGADISQGVLHEIVMESVKNPEKISQLKEVYQAIVDNAFTWTCMKKCDANPVKGTKTYKKMLRETMVWLLRHPLEEYENEDVIQYSISLGAYELFQTIVNTKGVLRKQKRKGKVRYDVTNFTRGTLVVGGGTGDRNLKGTDRTERAVRATCTENSDKDEGVGEPESGEDIVQRDTSRLSVTEGRESAEMLAEVGENGCSIRESASLIGKCSVTNKPPDTPYLIHLLNSFDLWKHTKILSTQPLKKLTQSHFVFIQRMYLLIGLAQLIYMTVFSAHHMPTVCTLSEMFNVSRDCKDSAGIINGSTISQITPPPVDSYEIFNQQNRVSWLLWPMFLFIGSCVRSYFDYAFRYYKKKMNSCHHGLKYVTDSLFLRLFCLFVADFILQLYRGTITHESYVQITAMIQLFGWLTALELFGAANKHVNILILLVKQMMKKDVPRFLLFFVLTVVAFSFALHSLRMTACDVDKSMTLRETFYGVLSSTFGLGSFYDDTIENSACAGGRTQYMFEMVYFAYVAATLIILMNILIGMITNRYQVDKESAENIWRYQNLSVVKTMEVFEAYFSDYLRRIPQCDTATKKASMCRKCMIRLAVVVCCVWCTRGLNTRNYFPERKVKRHRGSNERVYHYVTIKQHGDQE